MYLLAKFYDHRSHRNEISILIPILISIPSKKLKSPPPYSDIIFLKSEIPIFNSKIPRTAGRKSRRKRRGRRTQAIEKHYAFHTNANRIFNTGVSLWILRNFSRRLLWRKSVNGCLWIILPLNNIFIHLLEDWKKGVLIDVGNISTFAGKHQYRSVLFNEYTSRPAIESTFIQK